MYSKRRFYWLRTQARIILILFLCYQGSACALRKSELADSTPPLWEVSKTSQASNPSVIASEPQASSQPQGFAEPQVSSQTYPDAQTAAKGPGGLAMAHTDAWTDPPLAEKPPVLERDIVRSANRNRTNSETGSAKAQSKTDASGLAPEKKYTGKPISLDFQDADIRSVLRIIGEISKHNLVVDPDVKGRVTVTLQNPVPWDQALAIILKTNQLAMRMEGNIMRIGTQRTFMQEEDAILKAIQAKHMADQAEKNNRPLKTEIIPVNYAQASMLRDQISPMLSDSKGLMEPSSIIVDERTNSLIIKDLPENILKIKEILADLDRETPQVMIETRIVETSKNYLKELGIRWGGKYQKETNYKFPRTIGITGIRGGDYAVNLPNKGDVLGGIGLDLGHINNMVQLNLELDSMESHGKGRIISNPRIATLDNEKAEIKSGSQIPYPSVDKDGVQSTRFVDAGIRLGVTPHITPNNYITLEIEADKSEPNWSQTVNGVPAITTRTATTKLIVKDGDTTVIGGLYQRTQQYNEQKVPWFGNIPVIKWLFRSHGNVEKYDELLIFITPRIVGKK
ncbi:MAG: type IV pilus secretin PilQ [bacterium]